MPVCFCAPKLRCCYFVRRSTLLFAISLLLVWCVYLCVISVFVKIAVCAIDMMQLADKLPERYEGQRKTKTNRAVGNLAFPYSLYFVFYEQYAFIQVLNGFLTSVLPQCVIACEHSPHPQPPKLGTS